MTTTHTIPNTLPKVGIIGAGAWGTALALKVHIATQSKVIVWTRSAEQAYTITQSQENKKALPGIFLNPDIEFTANAEELTQADILLWAIPSQQMRLMTQALAPYIKPQALLLNCAKGIEQQTHALMTEIFATTLPGRLRGVLSGPNFAMEVAKNLPAGITVAIETESLAPGESGIDTALKISHLLGSSSFRPYASDDVIGVQIAGAVKNILAIACGILEGQNLGHNARAGLITRGLAEIIRLGLRKGAKQETFMGMAGLGDLVLTCTSLQSRNMRLGITLGKSNMSFNLSEASTDLTEGAHSTVSVLGLAKTLGVDMPIIEGVHHILEGSLEISAVIESLLSRPLMAEIST